MSSAGGFKKSNSSIYSPFLIVALLWALYRKCVLVCLGCHNIMPQMGQFEQQIFFHSSGLEVHDQGNDKFQFLVRALFLVCRWLPSYLWCPFFISVLILLDQGPILQPHLTLITSLGVLQIQPHLGLGIQYVNLGWRGHKYSVYDNRYYFSSQ